MSNYGRSRITSKGQVTIPLRVREALALTAGDEVAFVLRDGRYVIEARNVDTRSLRGIVKHRGKPVSLDEMADAIRKGAVEGER